MVMLQAYVLCGRIYYALCTVLCLFGFVKDTTAEKLPTSLQVVRNVLLGSVGRGKTFDKEGLNSIKRRGLYSFFVQSVPKKWFTHFYVAANIVNALWLTTTVLVFACGDLSQANRLSLQSAILVFSCLQIHEGRRLFENLFVHAHSKEAQMQLAGYIGGLCYYIFLPTSFFTFELIQSMGDKVGEIIELYPSQCLPMNRVADALVSQRNSAFYIAAFLLFCFGNVMQLESHRSLASLRRKPSANRKGSMEKRYEIPRGIWFSYCSNPHYLAEVMIYVGFISFADAWSIHSYLLMSMVISNLLISAIFTHEWYKSRFRYPKKRWAMFPFII